MTPPLARTNAEAHLYLDSRPCEVCGEHGFDASSAVVLVDGELCSRYRGTCPHCASVREYTFLLPEEIRLPVEREVVFGGPEPSQLLDPGEWLEIADRASAGEGRDDLVLAAAAVDEVTKFVPDGTDAVPPEAFWSATGRAVYQQEPGRFRLDRLAAVAATYRRLAS